jgi:hypothetical protein
MAVPSESDFATASEARRRRIRSRALLGVACVVVLVLVETTLRAGDVLPALRGMDEAHLFQDYPLVDHGGFVTFQERFNGLLVGKRFQTNRHGFRSPPIPVKRRALDELRVALLGTCITTGQYDESQDGYSVLASTIQRVLEWRHPELKVEVINASAPGREEQQDLRFYEAVLSRFEPDVVLLESGTGMAMMPGPMLEEYESYGSAEAGAKGSAAIWDLRRHLYDAFDRSVVISHYYDFRDNRALLFRKYFYRRPDRGTSGSTGGSRFVGDYVESVVIPASEHYRRRLAALYARVVEDAQVVSYVFPHSLPDESYDDLPSHEREYVGQAEIMLGLPKGVSSQDLWETFRISYGITEEITREEAAANGVHYVDLISYPALRRREGYHPIHHYVPTSAGAVRKGTILARYLLERFSFSPEGSRVGVTEAARD